MILKQSDVIDIQEAKITADLAVKYAWKSTLETDVQVYILA